MAPETFKKIATILLAACFICVLSRLAFSNQLDSTAAIAAATGVSKQVSTQEWLGPLSAVALSPFFGLACLSGAANYGPDWVQNRSVLLGPSSPLNNPLLFWIMLSLTIATSLPRFTKVSKPLALAAEKIEMFSVVIILIAMKFLNGANTVGALDIVMGNEFVLMSGIATMPADVLLSIAAALHIIVVNTIKLAFELLVWFIPIPTVDAFLEIANKSLCACLMGLYAYSPLLATGLNLLIFSLCCLVFMRVKRRFAYMKELFLMPFLRKIFSMNEETGPVQIGFLTTSWQGLPIKSPMNIERSESELGVRLVHRGWLKQKFFDGTIVPSDCRTCLLFDQITIQIESGQIVLDTQKGSVKQFVPDLSVAAIGTGI